MIDSRVGTDREHEVQQEFLEAHAKKQAEAAGDYRGEGV